MEIKNYGLSKEERISSKIEIDSLFTKGTSFISYPLRIVHIERQNNDETIESPVSIMVSVSKKKFKRAVKRNHLKRLIKESYRLNKAALTKKMGEQSKSLLIAFIYLPNTEKKYLEIESAMQKALGILASK